MRRGRPRTNPVRKYFSYDSESNTSTCQIAECGHEVTGYHGGNLERHLRERHPQEHAKLSDEKAVTTKRASSGNDEDSSIKKPRQVGRGRTSQATSSKPVLLEITEESIMKSCVELVTKNRRPFKLFDDSGFRKIIDPVLRALGAKEEDITAETVEKRVQEKAKSKREDISQSLSERMFSLKIDYLKKNDRQVLVTSAQYAENGSLILRPLAVKQVCGADDELLTSQVKSVLPRYHASESHLYSITTKVGEKALRTVCGRRKAEDEELDRGDSTCKANGSKVVDDGDEFVEVGGCVMEVLKLAVSDALKTSPTGTTIEKCRKLVKKLSDRSAMEEIKKRKLEPPLNDSSKTFLGTFEMLTRLLELKDFAADFVPEEERKFSAETKWEDVKEITASLQPAQVVMNMLLTEQLTLGDFYGAWLKCSIETSRIGSPLAKKLVECMKTRERCFRCRNTFCAALYMDPRYRIVLTQDEKHSAVTHLTETWKRIAGIKQMQKDSSTIQVSVGAADPDEPDAVEAYLREEEEKIGKNHNVSGKLDTKAIEHWLEKLDEEPRVPKSKNVLAYWEKRKESEPQLHALAQVVLSVPVTDESEKHAKSALRFISLDERSEISSRTLGDLVLLTSCSEP